jgi:medium-chain acyl-[acyl-carrier-protein] hydrolase
MDRLSQAGLYRPQPRADASLRLVCFPFAGGGSASYRLWPRHLPLSIDVVAVHPPGRAHRLREPPLRRVETMAAQYLDDLEPLLDRPVALFGHSLGGIVAAECARILQTSGRQPVHLFVSSRPAIRNDQSPTIHLLPDREFIAAMNRRYQGIPAEILKHPEIMELLLPALRADVEALETFRRNPEAPKIRCQTTVFGGVLDRAVSIADLESFRDEVSGPCRIRMFPGDHFYIEPQRENLLAEIGAVLASILNEAARKGVPA